MKKLKLSDGAALKEFNHASMPSHADSFFKEDAWHVGHASRGAASSLHDEAAGDEEPANKKAKAAAIDLSTSVPELYESMDSVLKRNIVSMQAAVEKAIETLEQAKPHLQTFSVAQHMFYKTCRVRLACGQIFLGAGESDCKLASDILGDVAQNHIITPPTPGLAMTATPKKNAPEARACDDLAAAAKDSEDQGDKGKSGDEKATQDSEDQGQGGEHGLSAGKETQEGAAAAAGPVAPVAVAACSASAQVDAGAPYISPAKAAASAASPSNVKLASSTDEEFKMPIKRGPLTMWLQAAVLADGRAKAPVQKGEYLYNRFDLDAFITSVLEIESVEKLSIAKEAWKKLNAMVCQLKEGVAKSSTKLKQTMDTMKRAADREKAKEQTNVEKQEISKAKRQAASAAEKLKQDAEKPRNLFAIGAGDFMKHNILEVPVFDGSKVPDSTVGMQADLALPLVLKNLGSIQEWKDMPKYQMAAGSFGGHYKMSAAAKKEGKCQMLMKDGSGKDETDMMFANICRKVGMQTIELGEHLKMAVAATWLEGFAPRQNFAGLTPQGLPVIKALTSGELHCFMCSLGSLIDAMTKCGMAAPTTETLSNVVLDLKVVFPTL